MQFTHLQKQHLYENGYIHVPGVVPRIRLDAALRAINHGVGQGIDPAQLPKYRAQSYVPEVSGTPPITDLLMGTPAWELCPFGAGRLPCVFLDFRIRQRCHERILTACRLPQMVLHPVHWAALLCFSVYY
jgi:hypothetical protein